MPSLLIYTHAHTHTKYCIFRNEFSKFLYYGTKTAPHTHTLKCCKDGNRKETISTVVSMVNEDSFNL